jgi:hypothetical protein
VRSNEYFITPTRSAEADTGTTPLSGRSLATLLKDATLVKLDRGLVSQRSFDRFPRLFSNGRRRL